MSAFYNEINPYAAQWLRNLIAAGHIAPGVVDERSIADLEPDELAGYTQCHFFAGIGVWSHALRRAGWPDDRPVWTGSCPCQPFSAAGKGAGHEDERHLWPTWQRLIRERRPAAVYGEQVAGAAGLGWLDVVLSDLEDDHYTVAAVDLCAAGVGAPHIRQRLFFVAYAEREPARGWRRDLGSAPREGAGAAGQQRVWPDAGAGELAGLMGDALDARLQVGERKRRVPGRASGDDAGQAAERAGIHAGAVEHAPFIGRDGRARGPQKGGWHLCEPVDGPAGFWSAADWIACRDGKARPVESGTFPLAHGAAARVGRLRAYGNAIVAPAAEAFIRAAMT